MGLFREEPDPKWVEAQLTLVRWHLDAMLSANADLRRDHWHRAATLFNEIEVALDGVELSPTLRAQLERELATLKARISALGPTAFE